MKIGEVEANSDSQAEVRCPLPLENIATIRTLNPAKFTRLDYADISFVKVAHFKCENALPGRFFRFFYPDRRFPPNTGGFLYLHRPPDWVPPLAYEIRFRVTNNSDPSSFASGHDLRWAGLPWGIPLLFGPYINRVVRHFLIADGTIPDTAQFKSEIELDLKRWVVPDDEMHYRFALWSLGQPFRMDLSCPRTQLTPVFTLKRPTATGRLYTANSAVPVRAPHTKGMSPKTLLSGTSVYEIFACM